MKWFIKCLKHYADFSGRARRKEYWMFALFNIIFAIAWTFLAMIIFFATNKNTNPEIATLFSYYSCYIVVMLPGMAVFIRRLHDVGKSGWMMLVSLIPIVGLIWLLVLMLTEGQQGENEYGPDPKTSPETFSEPKRLKSAGITLIVAFAMMIPQPFIIPLLYDMGLEIHLIVELTTTIFVIIAGALLLNEKQIYALDKNGRSAIMLLLASLSISLILILGNTIFYINQAPDVEVKIIIGRFISIAYFLSIALFIASILFSSNNKNLIRKAATLSIVFSGLSLLWGIYFGVGINAGEHFMIFLLSNAFSMICPVAYIVLAGTFLSEEDQEVAL